MREHVQWRRVLTATLGISLVVGAPASAAGAQDAGDGAGCWTARCDNGRVDDTGVSAELVLGSGGDAPPPAEGSPEAAEDPCEYRDDLFAPPISDEERERIEEQNASVEVDEDAPRLRSTWKRCPGGTWQLIMWWEQPGGGNDPVGPLIQQALAAVRPAAVALTVQPPAQPGVVVGIPAYFSIDQGDAGPSSATASAGPFSVTVTVTPTELMIEPGTGETLSCEPPGSRYQEGQPHPSDGCTHLYTSVPEAGSHLVTSYVVYAAAYAVTGPGLARTVDLGELEGPTTETDVTVREVRAVRTR